MFSGLVTEIGTVKAFRRKGTSARIEISCPSTAGGTSVGESIAVNGVCLTVVKVSPPVLAFDVVGNTLSGSNLRRVISGERVNLEKALKMGDAIGGHMVTGHIDGERQVKSSRVTQKGWALDISLLEGDARYLISKGSVAVDGVSLTVAELTKDHFRVYVIPHTLGNTTLDSKRSGDPVNVEFDMAAKSAVKNTPGGVTMDFLREKGFM